MRRLNAGKVAIAVLVIALLGATVYAVLAPRPRSPNGNALATGSTPGDRVYAYVGNKTVMLSDVQRSYASRNPSQQNLTLDEYFNATYVPFTMLVLDAERQGMTINASKIDSTITVLNETLAKKNVTFSAYLAGLNETMPQLRHDIERSFLLNEILTAEVASKVNVTAAEVEKAYNASGYAKLGIPLSQARNEIGPKILRQKQDERLHEIVVQLRQRYPVRYP